MRLKPDTTKMKPNINIPGNYRCNCHDNSELFSAKMQLVGHQESHPASLYNFCCIST